MSKRKGEKERRRRGVEGGRPRRGEEEEGRPRRE